LAIIPLLLTQTGCVAFDAGTSLAHATGPKGETSVLPRLGVRIQPLAGQSVVGGVEQECPVIVGQRPRGGPWRLSRLIGYANVPLPYEARVGAEVLARGGVGWAPKGPLLNIAGHMGAQVALPIRLSSKKTPWESDSLLYHDWLLVPSLQSTWYFSEGTGIEIGAGLSLRLQFWTGVAP